MEGRDSRSQRGAKRRTDKQHKRKERGGKISGHSPRRQAEEQPEREFPTTTGEEEDPGVASGGEGEEEDFGAEFNVLVAEMASKSGADRVRLSSEASWGTTESSSSVAPVSPDALWAAISALPLHTRLLLPDSFDHQRLSSDLGLSVPQSPPPRPQTIAQTTAVTTATSTSKPAEKEIEEELDELLKL